MPNLVGIFVSSTYFDTSMRSIYCSLLCLAHMFKMLGLCAHLICWLCDLQMQSGSNICSVISAYIELILYKELYIYIIVTFIYPLSLYI